MSEENLPEEPASRRAPSRPRRAREPTPSDTPLRATSDTRPPRRLLRRGDDNASRAAPPFSGVLLGRPSVATVTVGPRESSEHLFRRLLGAYLGGAREFIVIERPEVTIGTREVVRTFCRRTRQPEVVFEEGGVIRLRDLAYETPVPLPERLTRMGRIVLAFHREAVESWSELPLGEDDYWERRDDEIDREAWYVQRLAALRLQLDPTGVTLLGPWTIARSLERIADHATVIGETGRRIVELPRGGAALTSLQQFHHQAMDHLEGVLNARDDAAANDLLDMGEALLVSGRALSDRLLPAVGGGTMPPATAAAVTRILESIGRTVAYAQDIAQVVLDRAIPVTFSESPADADEPIAS
ncbi:MAG: PhoU domain-containing protein [Thermoplasmata archaeon]